ncbi:MAG: peptide-methionine (S)-S-oxide reductase MsrA [Alphaproteobacteria bacterium]|nr:peptide-methionine (S)-S-oxide reductase MsrA [Alphaproteobacteria bacterium]
MAEATFAAGCFWGVEEAFRKVPGVTDASVGYTGGATQTPTYEQICSGTTGHAEAIHIVFDETQVSFEDLLGVFFQIHDPRQVNRQGPDVGTQYRSAIFFHDASQETAARTVKQTVGETLPAGDPVATEIVPAATFWPAEDYHQQYFAKQRGGGLLGRLMGD